MSHSLIFTTKTVLILIFLGGIIFPYPILGEESVEGIQPNVEERKQELERNLQEIQSQIESHRQSISEENAKARSLERDRGILNREINKLTLEIKETDLLILDVEYGISAREEEIVRITESIRRQKEILAEMVRVIAQYDEESLLEIVLKYDNFSDFFNQLQAIDNIEVSLNDTLETVRGLKDKIEEEKKLLEERREELNDLKGLREIEKSASNRKSKEKENLLRQTRGREDIYQNLLNQASRDAATIRQKLYELEGRGVIMTFEKALSIAEGVSNITGVRPAFLLAVLKQETLWGANVGTGNWQNDMHPRDQAAFLQITSELGRNPDTTPVSRKPSYGWGGAMGPAQFIPTTWLEYKDRVAQLTGHNPPDPWDIFDSFTAAGVKLAGGGAAAKTASAEWKAAMIYFAGSRWNRPAYRFYGDSVMALAAEIQQDIDVIKGGE